MRVDYVGRMLWICLVFGGCLFASGGSVLSFLKDMWSIICLLLWGLGGILSFSVGGVVCGGGVLFYGAGGEWLYCGNFHACGLGGFCRVGVQ